MGTQPTTLDAQRLRLALDMYVTGEAMMLENLARRNPSASPKELRARLAAWLRERPGASLGDAIGRPTEWPRSR